MIIHYYTLHHVVKELQSLIGCRLDECFSQERNSLIMNFNDGVNNHYVQYYGSQPNTSLFIKKNFARARKNTVDLFESVTGEVLQSVTLQENNRIVQFDFINTTIFVLLFGGSNSNLIATNKQGKIIESLKSRKELVANQFEVPKPNLPEFISLSPETNIFDALSKCSLNLGKYYSEEVLNRLQINSKKHLKDFTKFEIDTILKHTKIVRSECFNSAEFYIYETEDGLLLSLIPLINYPKLVEKYSSVSDTINKRIISDIRKQSFNSLYKEMFSKLERQKNRLSKNIGIAKDENSITERAGKYKLFAELLMSYHSQKIKAGKEIKMTDYSGKEIQIPLDDKLTILENANRYFDKSRKAKEEIKIRKKRLPEMQSKLIKIENGIKLLKEAESYRDLESIRKHFKELTGSRIMDEKDNISTKFKEFDLGEGFILYVGKNAANNDDLTMKFAKPNDLWFHARGSGGSHAVLRLNKDQKPPKHIIKKAASIAAYYSQARNAKYVHVAYTQKKYVRKPKGANTGSVVISKEEVIMVEPGIPNSNNSE